jgi:hypothetical protein
MKQIHIFVIAVFRVLAVCIARYGIFATLGLSVVFSIFGGDGASLPFSSMLLRLFLVYILSAVIVWCLSRPIARLVTHGLDRD